LLPLGASGIRGAAAPRVGLLLLRLAQAPSSGAARTRAAARGAPDAPAARPRERIRARLRLPGGVRTPGGRVRLRRGLPRPPPALVQRRAAPAGAPTRRR